MWSVHNESTRVTLGSEGLSHCDWKVSVDPNYGLVVVAAAVSGSRVRAAGAQCAE